MTKEEIITAVRECAAKLERTPRLEDLRTAANVNSYKVRMRFGNYMQLLAEAGLDATGQGHPVEQRALFLDWAEIVRSLKKIPTIVQYEQQSKYSVRPLAGRYNGWRNVAAGMHDYLIENRLEVEWDDVMKVIMDHLHPAENDSIFRKTSGSISRPSIMAGQLVYGPPLLDGAMAYAPTNENGVLFVFGSVARELGFSVLHIQPGFPDCEAMREIAPGRWQRVRIEFEYQSRNFLAHMHPLSGCDLIVCWEHNWPDCPLEVIELKKVVGIQQLSKNLTTDKH